MNGTQAVIKSQTRHSAEQQRCRVYYMGHKVEDLRVFDGRHVEHILDILKVSSRAKLDELDAQAHEYHQADLAGSRQFSLR